MDILFLIVFQIIFGWSRTSNISYVAHNNIMMSLVTSTITKTAWLITTFLGIKGINDQDWLLSFIWIASGVLGDYFAMSKFTKRVLIKRSKNYLENSDDVVK